MSRKLKTMSFARQMFCHWLSVSHLPKKYGSAGSSGCSAQRSCTCWRQRQIASIRSRSSPLSSRPYFRKSSAFRRSTEIPLTH